MWSVTVARPAHVANPKGPCLMHSGKRVTSRTVCYSSTGSWMRAFGPSFSKGFSVLPRPFEH
eukprot:1072063-Prymnesium_polylepis.1